MSARWTVAQEFKLAANYARLPMPALCALIGRDEKSIYLKAWRMGVKRAAFKRETDCQGKRLWKRMAPA